MIDHINRDTLDNRKENLKPANKTNNAMNSSGANINNKTGHRNICEYDNKLLVQLQINGKNKIWTFALDEMDKAIEFSELMRTQYYQ